MATTRGYHFNPETGKTGKCDAEIKCRFADSFDGEPPHFATADEARAAYEAYTGETKGWFADAVKNCQEALQENSSVSSHEAVDVAKVDELPEQDLPITSESDLNHQTFAEHDGPSSYTVPVGAVNDARKLIDRANKKLERAGISERFEVTEGIQGETRLCGDAPKPPKYLLRWVQVPCCCGQGGWWADCQDWSQCRVERLETRKPGV